MHYTAEFRTHPPPQAAGTVYFAMDVDDVPAASSRPDRIATLSGPQELDLRRTLEQIVDAVPLVPLLDDPVLQMVEQLPAGRHALLRLPSACSRAGYRSAQDLAR